MEARIQLQRRRRGQVRLALWAAIAVLLLLCREVLFPFFMGALLAYLLHPTVTWLSEHPLTRGRLPRWGAILLVYAVGLTLLVVTARLTLPNLYRETLRIGGRLTQTLESSAGRLQSSWLQAHEWLRSHGAPDAPEEVPVVPPRFQLGETVQRLAREVEGRYIEFFGLGQRLLRALFGGVFTALLTLVSAVLFLLGREEVLEFLRGLLPEQEQGAVVQLMHRLDRRLSGVVRGQVTICLINGLLTLIGLLLFQVEFPFVLAAQATGFSLIPIFGTFISSVPILIVSLQQGFAVGLSMLGWILAIHGLEAYILNPKILGDAARIHPFVVLFALVAGEHYFGLWGAFLGAPVAAILVAIFEQAQTWADGLPG